jgi:hypothetical protein
MAGWLVVGGVSAGRKDCRSRRGGVSSVMRTGCSFLRWLCDDAIDMHFHCCVAGVGRTIVLSSAEPRGMQPTPQPGSTKSKGAKGEGQATRLLAG